MRPAQGEPCWQETGHIAEHMAQPPLDNAQRPAAGSFPAGVPPGGAFQKRVFRGEDAPRAAATLFNVGGGLVVRPSTHQSCWEAFSGTGRPQASTWILAASELYQGS
jgi:hypothetical protein